MKKYEFRIEVSADNKIQAIELALEKLKKVYGRTDWEEHIKIVEE
jgi:hypothetical protein